MRRTALGLFIVPMSLTITIVLNAKPTDVLKARSGSEFVQVSQEELDALGMEETEKFGESWKDPRGTIWGDAAKKKDGSFLLLTQEDAECYCEGLGASLPSGYPGVVKGKFGFPKEDSDYGRLQIYLGGGPVDSYNRPYFYWPQILPNLTSTKEDEQTELCFWSNSIPTGLGSDSAFTFNGRYGIDYIVLRTHAKCAVRCVVRTE